VIATVLLCLCVRKPIAAQAGAHTGEFKLLTYNVAGLPEGISRSRPSANIPVISRLLNAYDIVLVQEDFAYQTPLRRHLRHRFVSRPSGSGTVFYLGDGLSRFSLLPFHRLTRRPWADCHGRFTRGADCMASKGFSVATHRLTPRLSVDVYNLHMDAGETPGDRRARESQVDQLVDSIARHSEGRPVIVAGDTNFREGDEGMLRALLAQTSLRDCCTALSCGEDSRVDKVFYRGTSNLTLAPRRWEIDARFSDDTGAPLSDHDAVSVIFRWSTRGN